MALTVKRIVTHIKILHIIRVTKVLVRKSVLMDGEEMIAQLLLLLLNRMLIQNYGSQILLEELHC